MSTTEEVRGTLERAGEQAQERAKDVAGQARGRAGEEVDRRSTQAGEQLTAVAEAMRRSGDNLREQGKTGPAQAIGKAAEQAEKLGGYLSETNGDRLLSDIEDLGRRRPWLLGAAGAALGFVAARFLKASSSSRYEKQRGSLGDQRYSYRGATRGPETLPPRETHVSPGTSVGSPAGDHVGMTRR